ncbi:GNAT family N-acetyltransferase [Babesia caballi]|uniref:GNAT family N-acetyltransferase n=1 Tax=Babesia caballi TaxID=5871 RepID=A0AAV4LYW2_BABCB|nr:GNAT family N-acetyltransferase [Babesia caballi]
MTGEQRSSSRLREVASEVLQKNPDSIGLVGPRGHDLSESKLGGESAVVFGGGVGLLQSFVAIPENDVVDVVIPEVLKGRSVKFTDTQELLVYHTHTRQEVADGEDLVLGHENRQVLRALRADDLAEFFDKIGLNVLISDEVAIFVVNDGTVKVDTGVSIVAGLLVKTVGEHVACRGGAPASGEEKTVSSLNCLAESIGVPLHMTLLAGSEGVVDVNSEVLRGTLTSGVFHNRLTGRHKTESEEEEREEVRSHHFEG